MYRLGSAGCSNFVPFRIPCNTGDSPTAWDCNFLHAWNLPYAGNPIITTTHNKMAQRMEVYTSNFAVENNFVLTGTLQDIPKPAATAISI